MKTKVATIKFKDKNKPDHVEKDYDVINVGKEVVVNYTDNKPPLSFPKKIVDRIELSYED